MKLKEFYLSGSPKNLKKGEEILKHCLDTGATFDRVHGGFWNEKGDLRIHLLSVSAFFDLEGTLPEITAFVEKLETDSNKPLTEEEEGLYQTMLKMLDEN
jgi:hypothetical protein